MLFSAGWCFPAQAQYQISPGFIKIAINAGDPAPAPVSIQVSRSDVAGNFKLYGAAPADPWLSHNGAGGFNVTPAGPSRSEGSFLVTVNPAGLPPGVYNAAFDIRPSPGSGTVGSVQVALTVNPPPTLAVNPTALFFVPTTVPQYVTVTGTQAGPFPITYTVTANQPFVKLTKTAGSFASGGSDKFPVVFDYAVLTPDAYYAQIVVTASNGLVRVIDFTGSFIFNTGVFAVSPRLIGIHAKQGSKATGTVQVTLVSDTQIAIEPSASTPWVTVSPTSINGSFQGSVNTPLVVTVDSAGLAVDEEPRVATIALRRTGGTLVNDISFQVALTVDPPDALFPDKTTLAFSGRSGSAATSPSSQTVVVTNRGPATNYSISSSAVWIVPSKVEGSLKEDGMDSFSVLTKAGAVPAGINTGTVTLSAAGRATETINVILQAEAAGTDLMVSSGLINFAATQGQAATAPGSQAVILHNVGPATGYTVTPSAEWLQVSKASGMLAEDGVDSVVITLATGSLKQGLATGTVTIAAVGRPVRVVNVSVSVAAPIGPLVTPTLSTAPDSLSFSGTAGDSVSTPAMQTITVNSSGPATAYAVSTSEGWISVTKTAGTLAENGSDTFGVSADASVLGTGARTGTVTVSAPGRANAAIAVAFQVSAGPVVKPVDLTVSATRLVFSGSGAQTVVVGNSGPAVAYSTSTADAWIRLSKAGGSLTADGSDSFAVSVVGVPPEGGALTGTVTVAAPGRPSRTLTVMFEGPAAARTTLTVTPAELTFYADAGQTPLPQAVTVRAADGNRQTVVVRTASASNWLQADATVQTPAALGVRVAASGVGRPSVGQIDLAPTAGAAATATVPVTLRGMGAPVYSIPRVADGNGFTTSITVANLDSVAASVSLSFYKEDGQGNTTPWSPLMEDGAALKNVVIAVGGSRTWQTRGLGIAGENGWARVSCDQKISGFAVFRQTKQGGPAQEVAVPMNSGWQQRFLLPFDNLGHVTALALSNVSGTEPVSINGVFRDENGVVLGAGYRRTLPPLGHIAFALPVEAGRGMAEFVATGGRLSAVGLRFSATSSSVTSFEPQSLNAISNGALSIPQIADGVSPDTGAGFTTSITVVNNDIVPARVTLRFYRQNEGDTATRPWIPQVQGDQEMEDVEIQPGASLTWRTRGTDPFSVGWAEVISTQRVSGFAVFRQTAPGREAQEAAVPVNTGAQARFLLPFDNRDAVTTVALANISGSESALIDVIVRDEQQKVVGTASLNLAVSGHDAFPLTRFSGAAGGRGTAEFRVRSGLISAVGLRFTGEAFTSFRPQVF